MATMKDIAREAGVSYGTVSNVINKTGKVSIEKIFLVEAAAKKLGYQPHIQAQRLRQGESHLISVVLPTLQPMYCALYNSLVKCFETYQYEVSLTLTEDIAEVERAAIKKILASRPDAVITLSCLESPEDEYACNNLILIDRSKPNDKSRACCVSFDFGKAASEIASYCMQNGNARVAVFSSPLRFENEKDFCSGFTDSPLSIKLFSSDDKLILGKSLEILEFVEEFDSIITTDIKRAETLMNGASYLGIELPEIIALADLPQMPYCHFTQYILDYQQMGQSISDYLINRIQNKVEHVQHFLCANIGLRRKYGNSTTLKRKETLQFLTVQSPTTNALQRLVLGFERETDIHVNITALPYDELYRTVLTSTGWNGYDIIRMDMAWMQNLAKVIYKPLDAINGSVKHLSDNFLKAFGKSYCESLGVPYALPLDPSVQLLFYRKDLFENATIRRQYYEKYREELFPPVTFEQYNKIAAFFTKKNNPASPIDYGTVLTYGTASVAASDYLPRLLSQLNKDKKANQYSEIQQATELYLQTIAFSDVQTYMWWQQSVEQFTRGKAAMIIVFNNYAADMVNSKYSKVTGKIGYADIPGSHPLTGGGVIGISKTCRKEREAELFFKWIYSEEISTAITLCGGISPNSNIYTNFNVLSLFPWLRICESSFSIGSRKYFKSDTNWVQFENLLGMEVRNAATQITSVSKASLQIYNMIKDLT